MLDRALLDVDQARDRVALAVTAHNFPAADTAMVDLDAARTVVLQAMNPVLTEMNEELAVHLIRPRTRLWRRLRL